MSAHVERLMRLYNRLKRGPVTIEIISQWAKNAGMDVSERQLYRDLNQLKTLNINDGEKVIEFADEKNRKTWKLEFKDSVEKISAYDINSFYLLKNFAPYSILEERKLSIEKFEKIIFKDLSKSNFQQYIQANELYLRKSNYNENLYGQVEHKQMDDLIWALHNNKAIIIEQEVLNTAALKISAKDFPLKMFPMELVFHRGRVHIAGITKAKQFLIFTIDKLFQFSLTNESFSRKKLVVAYEDQFKTMYGISAAYNNKVYNIKIEFDENYGDSFKSFYWHSSQRWEKLASGNYMLHLKCSIGRELLGFIVSGLDLVKVHQPKNLKDLVIKKLQDNLAVYK
jgi:predicted DNA-binding transcriptional regulator YafY